MNQTLRWTGELRTAVVVAAASLLVLLSQTPAHGQLCRGDCDGNGSVDVGELATMEDMALGLRSLAVCVAVDVNGDGRITLDELAGPAMRQPCIPTSPRSNAQQLGPPSAPVGHSNQK